LQEFGDLLLRELEVKDGVTKKDNFGTIMTAEN